MKEKSAIVRGLGAVLVASLFASGVAAQTVLDSPELYAGEKSLYEAAKKEGKLSFYTAMDLQFAERLG